MGYFADDKTYQGTKIVRIREVQSDSIVGATGSAYDTFYRYPASFLIPYDDPQFSKDGNTANGEYGYMLNSRTWIYDIGLALMVFTHAGETALCTEMLNRLKQDQNTDGSWNFSHDIYIGQLFHDYIRAGAIGWVGRGITYYTLKTGDLTFKDMAQKAADYLLSIQVTNNDDLRYGLIRGGRGSYDSNYNFDPANIEWCSTEHNCSALPFLWDVHRLVGGTKYKNAALLVEKGLRDTLWDETNNRFYQGVDADAIDTAWALDATTWAGMAAYSFFSRTVSKKCGDTAKAVYLTSDDIVKNDVEEHYNMTYELSPAVDGFKPYDDSTNGYSGSPIIVWTEGSLGYAGLMLKLQQDSEAYLYIDEVIKIQDVSKEGGVLYVTETWADLPWEFHVWESVVSSAWLYMILKDPKALWPTRLSPFQAVQVLKKGSGKFYGLGEAGQITQT